MMLLFHTRNHHHPSQVVSLQPEQSRMVLFPLAAIFSVLLLHFLSSPLGYNNNCVVHSFIPTTTTSTIATSILRHGIDRSRSVSSTDRDNVNILERVSKLYSSNNAVVNGNDTNKKGNIIVVGATGYIGKAVVRECLRQNYQTFAFVRKELTDENIEQDFTYNSQSAIPIVCDVTNQTQVLERMQQVQETYCITSSGNENMDTTITAVVSCLASRSGVKKDAYLIDYQATLNCLQSAVATQTRHFILLSAFCVQKPLLQFQQAKLKFEAALQEEGTNGKILYTIVRPTAFFKSVSGQLEVVQSGAPFVLFDKGPDRPITACNPIAESDLATFMIDSITNKERHNQIINLGGPDEPITMLQQGNMLFNATQKEAKFAYAPVWIFDVVINSLQFVADLFQNEKIADMAETGRIGKYYAVEDMVTTLPNEKYGTITLQEHYNRIAVEGNDYDPYTTMFARARGIDVTAIQNDMKNTNVTVTTDEVKETVVR